MVINIARSLFGNKINIPLQGTLLRLGHGPGLARLRVRYEPATKLGVSGARIIFQNAQA